MNNFCTNCGNKLEENEKVCKSCGKMLENNNNINFNANSNVSTSSKTNGFAIAGFVISLVSILCCGFSSILGLIFSIIGLVNANKGNKEGKGLAIAGIVISSILLVLLIALYALGFATSFAEGYAEGLTGNYY